MLHNSKEIENKVKELSSKGGKKIILIEDGTGHAPYINNPNASCSGSHYGEGWINEKGVLVGLQDKFTSSYSYNGYMELQMGCVREDGSIEWPCPNG